MKQVIALLEICHYTEHTKTLSKYLRNVSKYLPNLQPSKSNFNKVIWRFSMALLLTRDFLTANTMEKEKMLKSLGSKRLLSAEQCDNDTSIVLVIFLFKVTSITLNLNKCTPILYQLYVHLPVQSQHNNSKRSFFLTLICWIYIDKSL